MTTSRTPQRGRPRDPHLDATVLRATAELLGENGYRGLRVGDVAARAGVGLGALYRRWPSKRDLVLAALDGVAPDRALPVTPDPAADVVASLRAIADGLQGPHGKLLTGLLSDLADDPELATAVRATVLATLRAEHRERLRRLIGDHPDLDLRADLGPAYVLFHGAFLGRAVTDDELGALLPLLTGREGAEQIRP